MMSALPDRAPPELEPGVTLDSLTTVEACDTALDRLTMAIPGIEDQLARVSKDSSNQPADWRRRAEMVLRVKKLLLPRLQQRRSDLARREKEGKNAALVEAGRLARQTKDRAILAVAREMAPDVMALATQAAVERHPDLFGPASGEAI